MYKIISDIFKIKGNRYAKMQCSCGYKTEGVIKGTKENGYKPLSKECKKCAYLRMYGPIAKRLKNYTVDSNNCHNWNASKMLKGYGVINYLNKAYKAHRIAYEVYIGPIPDGLIVRHKCDNPSCINPKHLELGTNQDNTNDKIKRGRQFNLKGINHPNVKLTEKDIKTIRFSKLSHRQLSIVFNVAKSTIQAIKSKRSWKHIN